MPAPSYVIFDTEYATDSNARDSDWGYLGQHREIIRIGAAKIVRGGSWDSFETFDVLVRPCYADHTPFAIELTGITWEDLQRNGLPAETAFKAFSDFVGLLPVFSNGNDINKMAETAGIQKFIMPLEPSRYGSLLGPLYRELRKRTKRRLAKRPWITYPSGRVHQLLNIPLPDGMGEVHTPLRDVWSLHVVIEALRHDGADVIRELQEQMMDIREGQKQMSLSWDRKRR